jgi:Na+/H+-dicarboxylate symporter
VKLHWQVLLGMGLGIGLGLLLQLTDAPPYSGVVVRSHDGATQVAALKGKAKKSKLRPGDTITGVIHHRGSKDERVLPVTSPETFEAAIAEAALGDVLWAVRENGDEAVAFAIDMDPDSIRARAIAPFGFAGDIFLALLKMLIVPIVFTSIVHGVAGIGTAKELRRLGTKAFAWYVSTSLLAIVVGQILVNIIRPGTGAALGLDPVAAAEAAPEASFIGVLKRMVPANLFDALHDNGAMLSIIFFALIFGYFITQTPEPHGSRVANLFESVLAVVMRLAEAVLSLIPFGVFALLTKVVAGTGFGIFKPLLLYMFTVALALVIHAGVTLPLLLRFFGKLSPRKWARAMSPALMTAFSTSSSSMTLPVTLETVEKRGHVNPKISSFTLPLGATINMDGTALYECIGVIFLAQYYASAGGFELTLGSQALVVIMALLASVGAAGIPSAGLVMMLTILSALGLPLEGAAILLAVDRPLDMMRTTVNVWSDSCGAAVIAVSEGDDGPFMARGDDPPETSEEGAKEADPSPDAGQGA